MAKKIYAKCTNIEGDCIVAKAGKVLEFPAGTSQDDMQCPECGEQLFEVKPPPVEWKKVLMILLPLLVVGLGGWYAFGPGDEGGKPADPKLPVEKTEVSTTGRDSSTIKKHQVLVAIDTTSVSTNARDEKETGYKETKEPVSRGRELVSKYEYGDTVANSRRIVDCDVLWQVWDGSGHKLDRIDRLQGCKCGSEQTFKNGNVYRIDCVGDTRRAVPVSK